MKGALNKNKYLRITGIILFVYILSQINFQELFFTFKNINLFYFLPAIVLLPLSPILRTLKWKILIDSQGIKISFKTLTKIFLKGLFLGTATPGKLGEFWKAKYLTEVADVSGGKAFYTALMDRLIDVVIIIAVGVAGVVNLFLFNRTKGGWSILVLLLILTTFIIYFLVKKESVQKILKKYLKNFTSSSLREKTDLFFDEFFNGMKNLNYLLFSKLLVYGFISYLFTVLVYYFLALSLGINISFFHLFLIVALVWLILTIPVTVFGLGTREASYIFFFSLFNITTPSAVAFSLLIFFIGILISIPGIILFLKKE